MLCNFIEIALRHGCSPVNLLYNFWTPFPKSTSGWWLLSLSFFFLFFLYQVGVRAFTIFFILVFFVFLIIHITLFAWIYLWYRCLKLSLVTRVDTSSPSEMLLGQGVRKIRSKFTREHPCRSVILIKLQNNSLNKFTPVNLLHIFRTPFYKRTAGGQLLGWTTSGDWAFGCK